MLRRLLSRRVAVSLFVICVVVGNWLMWEKDMVGLGLGLIIVSFIYVVASGWYEEEHKTDKE